MLSKKEEHDTLESLSEKDLWCQDLDAFVEEWETQLKEDADLEKDIRNRGRRASRKIGAGKTTKGRVKKEDDDFNPSKSKATKAAAAKSLLPNPNKGIVKVEAKPHQGFAKLFSAATKPKQAQTFGSDGVEELSGLSDDDFAELAATQPSKQTSRAPSEQPGPTNGRAKRTAAAAPKKWVDEDDESESDDGKFLGDVGDMVKGIGGGNAANGRLSLFAMSASRPTGDRPTSSSGLPKIKSKASRVFDDEAGDETNYELLAKSSPQKPPRETNLDSFLSDDDLVPITKKVPIKSAPAPTKPAPKRGPKPKAVVAEIPAVAEPKALSPAAKAYAAKQSKLNLKQDAFSATEDSDIEMNDSPPPKPATKQSKAKALSRKNISDDESDVDLDDSPPPKPAAKTKAKATAKKHVISDDDEDMSDVPVPKLIAKAKSKAPVKAKANVKVARKIVSEDEDDELDEDSPPPKPAGRGRPARAAVAKAKPVPVYIDSDDDDDMDEDDLDASAVVDEPSEDDFDESE